MNFAPKKVPMPMNEERIYQLLRLEESASLKAHERRELSDLRLTQSADVKAVEQILSACTGVEMIADEHIDASWNDVVRQIEASPVEFSSNETAPVTAKQPRRSFFMLMGLAASFLIVASVYFLLPAKEQALSAERVVQSFDLDDGSHISVNRGSTVLVDRAFNENARKLNISGETYIEAKSSSIPMIVTSDQFDIRVLGTRFNVMDYPTNNISSVTLYEGSIQLTLPDGTSIEMAAGDHICWNQQSQSISKSSVESSGPAWVDGGINFENAIFEEVFERLEQNHGVSFSGKELIDKMHFNYSAPHESLEEIISEIQLATGTSINKTGQKGYRITPKE